MNAYIREGEACKLTGKSHTTIQRAGKAGEIAYKTDARGWRLYSVVDLERRFGLVRTPKAEKDPSTRLRLLEIERRLLDQKIAALERRAAELEREREEWKEQAARWEKHAERSSLLLGDERVRAAQASQAEAAALQRAALARQEAEIRNSRGVLARLLGA